MTLTVPVSLRWLGDKPLVAMARIDVAALDRTFWDECTKGARVHEIVALDDMAIVPNRPRLSGQIFHMTRCGSTALLKQFAALDRTAVLSEPMIFLELLGQELPDQGLAALRTEKLMALFEAAFEPLATRLVVKWPTLLCRYASILQQAFPAAPAVFIHRNPIEVLASIEARPLGNVDNMAAKWRSAPQAEAPAAAESQLAGVAQLLGANCRWLTRTAGLRSVDYQRLPEAGWQHVAPHFKLELAPTDIERMMLASRFDAKQPSALYENDSAPKQRAASANARHLAETLIGPGLELALGVASPL
ncbi:MULTISPECIES: hypothetical protein [unclassified Novosphingobium]|uniref:hypothetical protein n=1 Tax=unclassified Novosphingobium TaxID=2644732 RepID=UPI002600956F|nr:MULTISPECIES: hypothetical protein [unclassified Novosphingobium]HQV03268.1 hypothetical protein [Novosphingobium sp.]